MKQFYFGHQTDLKILLGFIERNYNKNVIKFSIFYRNLTDHLMNWRAEHGSPAFEVDEELVEAYKRGFELNNKYLSITSAIIASDAKYN